MDIHLHVIMMVGEGWRDRRTVEGDCKIVGWDNQKREIN